MTETELASAVGYTAGILRMISFVPQVLKTLRTRKAHDISLSTLIITLVTTTLYIAYGYMLKLMPIVATLSVLWAMVLFQIALTVRYSRRHAH